MLTKILKTLETLYPFDGKCFLNYSTPWQLLFATILSAQCTDACVNSVTEKLFADFPTLEDYATADITKLETAVHKTGFFRMKARHLQETAKRLLHEHGGEVPFEIDELTALSGVGRKTANVVRGHIFKIPSIVVDTHVKRVSNRLGLVNCDNSVKIEFELMGILPENHWIPFNQQVITHGRLVCKAQKPLCSSCELGAYCEAFKGYE